MRVRGCGQPVIEPLNPLEFRGRFSSHLTVNTADHAAFKSVAQSLGIDAIVVLLEGGGTLTHPVQPMTSAWHVGTLDDVLGELREQTRALAAHGLVVTRTKVEATLGVVGVPKTDAEAAAYPDLYFEQHLLVPLADEADRLGLAELCNHHNAHLSKTPRCSGPGGERRYVTMRHYNVGMGEASRRMKGFQGALKASGRKSIRTYWEYAVYDDRISLDTGWT